MKITYIGHSGFLAETSECYYLFDYYQGTLPPLQRNKHILVFSSHAHQDHYNPEVFKHLKSMGMEQITAVLSKDIPKKKYPSDTANINCVQVSFHQSYDLPCNTALYTLHSTDAGVAFLLQCSEGILYHAGDLNDWSWDGEPEQENRQMTGMYRHEIDILKEYQQQQLAGKAIDTAFIPLDPRQEIYYAGGLLYFLKQVKVSSVYPMHFWEHPEIIDQFLTEYPEYSHLIQKEFV